MKSFKFDLQRFATQTINAGETQTLDGVTYTALDGDAVLNLDDDGKVSGLASGKVSAVVADASDSPTVTFDATGSAFNFTATSDGKVISITPFPIEFISGEFTYNGGRLDITAGSDLALVTQRGDFILRNENHFVTDSAYIFTSTSLTSDSEHVVSKFSLTNGDDVRELNLEQLGTVINHFDQQGVTLVEGSSEVLNIGNYKLTATATDGDAGLNFELGEDGMTFVPNTGDGKLTVALTRGNTKIFGGVLECTSGSITFGYDHAVTFAKDTSFNFTTPNNSVLTVTANGEATTAIELTDNGITFTPGSGDGGLDLSLSKKGTKVFDGSLNITDGTINFDTTEKKFSFSDGTKVQLGIFGLEMEVEVVGNTTVGSGMDFKIDADANGNLIFTPDENGGSFNIALKRDNSNSSQNVLETTTDDDDLETFFENNVTVNGPIMFNAQTGLLTLLDGTEISLAFDNYTMTATADGDASSTLALTEEGISITPQQGDGTLNLTLGSTVGSMNVGIEVLSGGFVFGENGALNVVEGTELQLKFSDDYIVNFKTTDAAGGALSLGADGLSFTPAEGDGHLELTVSRGDETRTTSLEMTGSLTYKLDGAISLAEGTVLKNVFEDGNVLTITALTDASGSIIFHPAIGLQITPSTPDALNVVLTSGDIDVFNITSISGSVYYKGGVITASDGTEALFTNYYMDSQMKLSTDGGFSSLEITADSTSYTANEGATFVLDYLDGDTLEISGGKFIDDYEHAIVTAGSIFKTNDDEDYFYLQTAGNYTLNGISVTTTEDNVPVMLSDYKTVTVDGISYTPLDENVALTIGETGATVSGGKVSMQMEGFSQVSNFDTTDGSISYNSTTNKFSVKTGTKAYIENFPDQFVAQGDFDVKVEKNSDGTFTFSTDDTAALAIERNGNIIISTTITLDGSIIADPSNNQISLPKDTTFTMTPGDDKVLEIKALDDAGGKLSLVDGGIRFAPNENDGALELNFVSSERKVQLDVTGAFTYKGLGALALEDGTEGTFTWEDGNSLKLTSSGSTGSIGIDPTRGLKITSDDENLSMTFSTPAASTDISNIKGTIYYNAGVVSFDENSKITATSTLGGQPIFTTLEALDGTASISFNTTNGVIYSADTGALRVTWSRDDLESTFTVNSGSVQLGHNLFQIAEGSDIATDLKTFVPAFYFTTSEAGTYTINGQTITTSAEGLALTATDDQMVFVTSDDAVTYEGMTFAGAGKVSLKPASVVLGAGVEATGFKEGNTFMLAEAGNVTADAKIFELSKIEGTPREIPMEISVHGAKDGFIFSRTLTKESEAYLDDALNEEDFGNYSSSYIGQVFTEKFISAGDSSYRIRTDAIGLEEVIGISDGATVTGGASLADEPTLSYYNLVTDTEGNFTIGEKTYNVSGDSSVAIRARFEVDTAPYASYVDSLSGTVSGDFTGGEFKINGGESIIISGDSSIDLVAGKNGIELFNVNGGASLIEMGGVSKVHTDTEGTFTFGNGENDTLAIKISGDSSVTFELDDEQFVTGINDVEGDITFSKTSAYLSVNGISGTFSGEFSSMGAYSGALYIHDAQDGSVLVTDDADKIWVQMRDSSFALNDNDLTLIDDADGIWIRDKEIIGLDDSALLRVSETNTYVVNGTTINANAGDYIVGFGESSAFLMGTNNNTVITGTDSTDYIANSGASVIFQYSGGNDTISGFNATSTLSVGDSAYSTATSGDDVIVTVGESKITLINAASLPSANIESTNPLVQLVEAVLKRTAAGYPAMAAIAFHPTEKVGDEPTNYSAKEDWTITSTDNLKLHAVHYTPENSNDKWVVLIHGYGHYHDAMYPYATAYLANGYNVLMIDQRAAGESEGTWLTMGAAESADVALWTQEIARRNSNAKITLHGVSMGSATAMLAAARSDATNVTSLVEDCGYTNIIEVLNSLNEVYLQQPSEVITAMDFVAAGLTGHYLHEAAPIGSISSATMPSIFITGDADTVVPLSMLTSLYDASGAEVKETFIVEGAAHANAVLDDSIGYNNAVFRFVAEADGEGWVTENTTDGISLRGTKYGDSITNRGTSVTIDAGDGNDYIENNVDSSLVAASLGNSIAAGAGNDTIYSYHTYNPTLLGGAGNDSIVVERGHLNYIEGGAGNDTIIGVSQEGGWGMGNYSTVLGGAGDDYINPIYSANASIDGGEGDDTILANGASATIDGGNGNNLIVLTDSEGGVKGKVIVLNGNTTVESFNTGFGEGTDTMYIDGDPAGVYFNDGVLTFSNSTDSLTFSDVTTTAKVNIYHKRREVLNKGVFIAADDWYKVEDSDLTVNAGEEVYFVGPSATEKHGVDFSGISSDLNVTMDTAYIDSEDYVPGTTTWINGVYSLRGGAGNTTITGSDKADTIIAGTGATTINAGAGENLVNLEDAESALIQLAGNTTVEGFKTGFGDGTDTIYIDGDPAGVYFKDGVLAFGNSTDSLTFSDVTTTAKVNIYHKRREMLNKGVFIAAGDWYKVEDSDLTVDAGEEVYFVGTAADPKAGVDFSDISSALNITMNTAYIDSEDYVPGTTTWINGVYSLKGGAGLTTVTGSDQSDTILAGTGKTTINAGAGDDVISLQSSAALVQYNAGDGNDTIINFTGNSTLKIADETYTSQKSGDDLIFTVGDDKITLAGAANLSAVNVDGTSETQALIESISADKVSVVSAGETSAQNISLSGDELIVIEDTSAKVSITASKGSDTIYSAGENVIVNLTGGATDLIVAGGKMTVENYNATTGAAFVTNYENILTAVDGGAIYFDKGKMSVDSAIVDFNGINSGIVNFYDASGELQKVAPVSPDESLDLSKEKSALVIGVNENSTLTSGSGDDSIFAYAGSHIDAGAGKNYIEIEERGASDDGVTIALNEGRNTIAYFNAGFGDDSDKLFFDGNAAANFEFDGTNLNVRKNNNPLCGILSNVADGADFVNILAADKNSVQKVVVAQAGATVKVEDEVAALYVGDKSGVDFADYDGTLNINLGSVKADSVGGDILFGGINQVTLGSGRGNLIGSASRETLAAGTGAATINGGAGNDLLIGNTSTDKDGATEFVFETGGGRDTVSNFEFLTDSNLMTADKISVDSAVTNVVLKNSGDVIIQTGDDWLTLENAQGNKFKINDLVATVDKDSFDFDGTTNYFLATGKRATLTVGEDVGDEAIIWLGNQRGSQFVGDFRNIDASNSTAKTELAGNDADNTITAGLGDASLWGGNGGDDLLTGGAGRNMFFYAAGNGNDTIQSANDGDFVYLSNVSLENIIGKNFENGTTTLNFNDGGSLTVNDTGKNVGFVVGEQTFYVNSERNDFTQR